MACQKGFIEIIEALLDYGARSVSLQETRDSIKTKGFNLVEYSVAGKIIMKDIPRKHREEVRKFLDSYVERNGNIKPALQLLSQRE